MQRSKAIIGSAIFFVLVPCVFAGVIPWWMTGWRIQPAFLGQEWLPVIGVLLIASGVPGLVDSFVRFAVQVALKRDQARREEAKGQERLKADFETLTAREQEVMALVAAGLMNKQIAAEIGVSEITVKVHRGNVTRKMGARSLADLVRMADLLGLRRKGS